MQTIKIKIKKQTIKRIILKTENNIAANRDVKKIPFIFMASEAQKYIYAYITPNNARDSAVYRTQLYPNYAAYALQTKPVHGSLAPLTTII